MTLYNPWCILTLCLFMSSFGFVFNQGCDCFFSRIPVLYYEKCHICESCKAVEKKIGGYRGCMVGGGTSQTNMTDTVIGNCYLKSPRAYIILSPNCSMIRYHTLIGWRDQPSNYSCSQLAPALGVFRRFLPQLLINLHKILQALFAIIPAPTQKNS